MVHEFAQLLSDRCQVEPGSSLVVGVSGGADSVALLHLLATVAAEWPLTLRVAHLDHALRERSAEDALWVEQLCAQLAIPFESFRIEVAELARQRRQGIEEAARFARYRFLRQQADKHRCKLVALGHHQGDQAETFLMRLLRGSGATGLCGMGFRQGQLIRPLLGWRREKIEAYLNEMGQSWLFDASNHDLGFTRNRIRHELLPQLATFNPQIEPSLCRLSARVAEDEAYWSELVDVELRQLDIASTEPVTLPAVALRQLHPALRKRVIRRLLEVVRNDVQGISAAHIEIVENLLMSDRPQASVDLPGVWVARRYASLQFARRPLALAKPFAMSIPAPGSYRLADGSVLQVACDNRSAGESPWQVEFASSKVCFPLQVRNVLPGDRFRPSGMRGRKKLKNYFIDAKLTREERTAALVLVGDEILWLLGYRRCEGLAIAAEEEELIRLTLEPTQNGQTTC
jgi:tRNA(Ile)-lysidine synthase